MDGLDEPKSANPVKIPCTVEALPLSPPQHYTRLHELNQAPSRRTVFEQQEKATLQPLPAYPFDYLEIKQAKVHIDYHVSFEKHNYSVPYKYIRQTVLIRASERLVEDLSSGYGYQRIAVMSAVINEATA